MSDPSDKVRGGVPIPLLLTMTITTIVAADILSIFESRALNSALTLWMNTFKQYYCSDHRSFFLRNSRAYSDCQLLSGRLTTAVVPKRLRVRKTHSQSQPALSSSRGAVVRDIFLHSNHTAPSASAT
jgi:hypothetical protein